MRILVGIDRVGRVLALTVAVAAGCGGPASPPPTADPDGPPPDTARADLAARAAAAQDLVGVATYTYAPAAGAERTVRVVRAPDGAWRVDVPGGALGGASDVTVARVGGEQYHCAAQPAGGTGCVPVGELPPEADPRVQHAFTSWLEVFTDRAAPVSVSAAPTPSGGVDGACFAVEPRAAALVAVVEPGTYCYREDGTLTFAELPIGTLTLAGTEPTPPATVELPGPVTAGDPAPTAAATPPPGSASPEPPAAPAG